MKEIFTRRSIRKFKDQSVTDAQIKDILRAGFYAPSAGNEQSWKFGVVTDKNKLKQLADISVYWASLNECAAAIVIVGDLKSQLYHPMNWLLDCSAAAQNMLLEIEHLGLGAVWLGAYPEIDRMKIVSEIIGADNKDFVPFAVIALGHANETRTVPERYNEEKVFYNHL